MAEPWTSSLNTARPDALRFAGVWLGLNLFPFLPPLVSPLPVTPYFPICVEVLVIVTGLTYAAGSRWEGTAQRAALAALAVVVGYQVYDAVVYTAFRRHGILYEDIQFVDTLAYLVTDVATWTRAGVVIGALGACGVLAILARWGVREITRTGRYGGCRMLLVGVHVVVWPLVGAVGPVLEWGTANVTYQSTNERVRVRTVTTKAWANIQASGRLRAMLDSMTTAPVDSTYATYDTLTLRAPPPVYLVAVESYGTTLDRHPALRGPYRQLMRRSESVLSEAGWHAATARVEAPVQGGRSWLAIASLLTGVRVEHQLVYNRFRERARDVPQLVRFLDRQGYHTVALQPFTFARPGLPVRNIYGFDVTLYRDDLRYRGPSYGLADAPDQYSLGFAHATQIANRREPFFLFFETVDSHALWNYGLPPYVPDWRQFNAVQDLSSASRGALDERDGPGGTFLPDSVTRPRIREQSRPLRYLRHIAYDLRVIREYMIEKAPKGSLVFLLGDHQPPLFETEDKTVPLHVLSTDSTFVNRVRRDGFTDGLLLKHTTPTVRQESLYSRLVRLLVARDRSAVADTTNLPPIRPTGVSPSLLVR